MSESISVDISGVGDHVLVPGEPRTWLALFRVLLTVSEAEGATLGITAKSNNNIKLGPFFMQNGGTFSFSRENVPLMRCDLGEDLIVELDGPGRLGGTMVIQRGQL